MPAIITGFTVLTGPIGLVIAALTAIGVIIYKNWAPIKQTLIDIANYFIDLYNESTVVRVGVEGVVLAFKTLFEIGKFIFETLKNIIGGFVDTFVNGFKTIGRIIKAVLTGNISDIPGIIESAGKDGLNVFKGFTKELANDWKNLTNGIKQNADDALANITSRKKIAFLKSDVDASGLTEALSEATEKGIVEGQKKAGLGGRAKTQGLDTAGLSSAGLTSVQSPLSGIAAAIPNEVSLINEQQQLALSNAVEFNEGFSQIIREGAEGFAAGFGEFIASFASGNANIGSLAGLFLTTIADMAIRLGKLAISIGFAVEGIKAALKSLNPVVAVAAGVALVALGTLVKGAAAKLAGGGQTAFANGGIVYGPTNALIGEYAGARNNPEVVAPLDKLKKLIQPSGDGSPIILGGGFKLTGDQLQLVLDRADKKRDRRS